MSILDHLFEDIRKAIACICCLVLLGPCVFIIGVWQFASAPTDHERADNIHSMNNAIDLWTSTYEASFAKSKFAIHSEDVSASIALSQNNQIDSSLQDKDFHSYKSIAFDNYGKSPLKNSYYYSEGLLKRIFVNTQLENKTNQISFQVELFSSDRSSDSESTCDANNGQYNSNGCTYYYVLDSICAKVSMQGNGYALDTTYGGPGCTYSNGFPADSGKWIPATYRRVSYNNGGIFSTPFYFTNTQVMIRHQNDPYVFAQHLTSGTMRFGLTPGEKLLLGIVLMVVGGIFMIPCCIIAVMVVICTKRRKHHHHHHYHIVA